MTRNAARGTASLLTFLGFAVTAGVAQPLPSEPFLLDSVPIWLPVDSIEDSPAVACDGNNYLVVWQTRRGAGRDIHAARITQSGQVLDRDGLAVSFASGDQLLPAVVSARGHYLVVWEDRRSGSRWDIYGARVDTAGRVLDPDGLVIRAHQWTDARRPAVAASPGRCLVVWQELRWDWDIVGALVDSAGNVGQAFTVSAAPDSQTGVAVAATEAGFVVAWQDNRSGYPQAYCARVDSIGTVLDTAGLPLWPDRYAQERPSVSWNETRTLVIWEEHALLDTDVYGMRVGADGTMLDTAPIRVASGPGRQRRPRVVRRAQDEFVVWDDTRNLSSGKDIYAARILADGTVRDPQGVPICRSAGAQDQACVAWVGSQTIVAWVDRSGDTLFPDVVAARLSPGDSLLDPEGFVVADLQVPMFYHQQSPAAGFDGANYLVVWTDFRSGQADIYGARVSPAGISLDSVPLGISTAPGSQDIACVASDSSGFLVLWVDGRQGQTAIYGARVSSAGTLLDTAGFAVSFRVRAQISPAVAFDGENYLVVWSEGSPTWPVLGARVTRAGAVLDTTPILVSSRIINNRCPAVASSDSLCLVVWQTHSQNWDITGARVDRSGMVLDTICLQGMTGVADQYGPSVCFDGTAFLVAFQELQVRAADIYATRVLEAGVVKDTYGFPVSQSAVFERDPAVACDGHHSVLVWQAYESSIWSILGARLASSRHVEDTFTLASRLAGEPAPALSAGRVGQLLLAFVEQVDSIGRYPAGVRRVAGLVSPFGGVEDGTGGTSGTATALRASPNPFRRSTLLSKGAGVGQARVRISDAAGRIVREFVCKQSRGVTWDGAGEAGNILPPGVYFTTLETAGLTERLKLVKLE